MIQLPKAVFFDWDGTLVDSFSFLHAAHNYARAQFGMPSFTLEKFSEYFGQPREQLYAEIYGENKETAKTHFESFVYNNYKDHLKPLPHAEEVVRFFYEHNIPCGVVSNKKRDLIEAEIENYGWQSYFISLVGAAEAQSDKPSSLPLKLAVERMGVDFDPSDIWFVGDTDNDLACSNEFGTQTVFIEKRSLYEKLSKDFKIDHYFTDTKAFYDFLLQNAPKALLTSNKGENP